MDKEKIEQAISYASSSNQIESNKPTKEELELLKQTLLESKPEKELIQQFTNNKVKNGKVK